MKRKKPGMWENDGVRKVREGHLWLARLTRCGKDIRLGAFETKEEAQKAVAAGRIKYPEKQKYLPYHIPGFKQAYTRYSDMRARCVNKNVRHYNRYGGRGIECRITREEFIEWFLKNANGDFSLSVDRIDNDGHYEFSNMQLITVGENSRKARRESDVKKPPVFHIRVCIGDKKFNSMREASLFFGKCKSYISLRVSNCNSLMPDGTPIIVEKRRAGK
jgi:hypothetical protein